MPSYRALFEDASRRLEAEVGEAVLKSPACGRASWLEGVPIRGLLVVRLHLFESQQQGQSKRMIELVTAGKVWKSNNGYISQHIASVSLACFC
eukprot:1139267-Pelagomonas_calceolata.AAC.3